jgi:hypothetical protein
MSDYNFPNQQDGITLARYSYRDRPKDLRLPLNYEEIGKLYDNMGKTFPFDKGWNEQYNPTSGQLQNRFDVLANENNHTLVISVEGSVVASNWASDLANAGASEYKKLQPYLEAAYAQLRRDFPDYNIVMEGHSLGGGIAQTFALKHGLDVQTLDSLPVPGNLFRDGTLTQADLDRYKAGAHRVDAMNTSMDIATFLYDKTLDGVYLWRESGQSTTVLPGASLPYPLRLVPPMPLVMAIDHSGAVAQNAVVGLSVDERSGKFILPDNPAAFAAIPVEVRKQLGYLNPSPIVGAGADQSVAQRSSFVVTHMNGGQQWIGVDLERQQAIVQQMYGQGYQELSMRSGGPSDVTIVQYDPNRQVLGTTVRTPDGHGGYTDAVAAAPAMDARLPAAAQPAVQQYRQAPAQDSSLGQAPAPEAPRQSAKPLDPRDAGHPDHKMYLDMRQQLVALNDTQGIKLTPEQLENGTAALMADARASHIRSVTQLGFGVHKGTNQTDISHVVVYQGQPQDLASDISVTNMAQAINAPAEQSYRQFDQNTQAMVQHQQAFQQLIEEQRQSQGGPVMSMNR